jgi:DNA polymerase-3 subunit delta
MTAIKAHQADAFLKSPDKKLSAFLLYGTDAGLVSERAQALAATLAKRENPEGEVLRIDDMDLENDSGRLAVELGTMPMFGGRKIVRATTGRRLNTLLLKPLIEGPQLEGFLIVEAGNLKTGEPLRNLFEKPAHTVAIPCFGDETRDIDTVVREALAAEKIAITPDAKALLVSRLGADRAMTRSEIEKLALYAKGKKEIEIADVEAITGDASELAIDRILTAAASGDAPRVSIEFARAIASGESAQGIIAATERYFHRLHRLRAALDKGQAFDDAARALRPPLHFKLKDALAAQCRQWTSPRLGAAMARITTTAKAARLAGPLEDAHAERLLLALAMLARGKA